MYYTLLCVTLYYMLHFTMCYSLLHVTLHYVLHFTMFYTLLCVTVYYVLHLTMCYSFLLHFTATNLRMVLDDVMNELKPAHITLVTRGTDRFSTC